MSSLARPISCLVLLLAACMDEPTSPAAPDYAIAVSGSLAANLGVLPGGALSHAEDVNAAGHVVGRSSSSAGNRAFLWTEEGGMQSLGTFASESWAFALNDDGVVVGYSDSAGSTYRAFRWTAADGMRSLGTLGGWSLAYGINAAGVIVGESDSLGIFNAFRWTEADGMWMLGSLGGTTGSKAYGVNDLGHIVGQTDTPEGPERAFLWILGTGMSSLGALSSGASSRANDINNEGRVVGWSGPAGGRRAFVWTEGGGMQQLPSLPDAMTEEAYGINEDGEIVGVSMNTSIVKRAVVWIPDGEGGYTAHEIAGGGSEAWDLNENGHVAGSGHDGGLRAMRWTFGLAGEPPTAPGKISATVLAVDHVRVTWPDLSVNEFSFRVQRQLRNPEDTDWGSWTHLETLPAGTTAYDDHGVVQGETYRYRVRACSPTGCSGRNGRAVHVDVAPTAPTDPAATGFANRVELTWTDASGNETEFRVDRRVRDPESGAWGPWTALHVGSADDVSHIDASIARGTSYRYRIRACNAIGCSAASLTPTVLADEPPATPDNFFGAVVSPAVIQLNWEDVGFETHFQLQRRHYDTDTSLWTAWSTIFTGPEQFYVDNGGITPGVSYRYRVRACNLSGCSSWTPLIVIVAE